jgi:hypothetical protein
MHRHTRRRFYEPVVKHTGRFLVRYDTKSQARGAWIDSEDTHLVTPFAGHSDWSLNWDMSRLGRLTTLGSATRRNAYHFVTTAVCPMLNATRAQQLRHGGL